MAYEIVIEHVCSKKRESFAETYVEHGKKSSVQLHKAKQRLQFPASSFSAFTLLWLFHSDFRFDVVSFCLQDINNVAWNRYQ